MFSATYRNLKTKEQITTKTENKQTRSGGKKTQNFQRRSPSMFIEFYSKNQYLQSPMSINL